MRLLVAGILLWGTQVQAQTLRAFLRLGDRLFASRFEKNLVSAGLDSGCAQHLSEALRLRGGLLLDPGLEDPSLKALLSLPTPKLGSPEIEALSRLGHSQSVVVRRWLPDWIVPGSINLKSFDESLFASWIRLDLEQAGLAPVIFEQGGLGLHFHGPSSSLRFVKQRWSAHWNRLLQDLQLRSELLTRIPSLGLLENLVADMVTNRGSFFETLQSSANPTSSAPSRELARSLAEAHGQQRIVMQQFMAEIRNQLNGDEAEALTRLYGEQLRHMGPELSKLGQALGPQKTPSSEDLFTWAVVETRKIEAQSWLEP
jgi:hypothetical protein